MNRIKIKIRINKFNLKKTIKIIFMTLKLKLNFSSYQILMFINQISLIFSNNFQTKDLYMLKIMIKILMIKYTVNKINKKNFKLILKIAN